MKITRPIRIDAVETEDLSQSLHKARLISFGTLCNGAIDVEHHEFHRKRMAPNENKLSDR